MSFSYPFTVVDASLVGRLNTRLPILFEVDPIFDHISVVDDKNILVWYQSALSTDEWFLVNNVVQISMNGADVYLVYPTRRLLISNHVIDESNTNQNDMYAGYVSGDFVTDSSNASFLCLSNTVDNAIWNFIAGVTGMTGFNSTTYGATGSSGATGVTGSSGPRGNSGATGFIGLTGATGEDGALGPVSSMGYKGASGQTGLTGTSGNQGIVGPRGKVGASGQTGPIGLDGPPGPDGYSSVFGSTATAVGLNFIGTGIGSTGVAWVGTANTFTYVPIPFSIATQNITKLAGSTSGWTINSGGKYFVNYGVVAERISSTSTIYMSFVATLNNVVINGSFMSLMFPTQNASLSSSTQFLMSAQPGNVFNIYWTASSSSGTVRLTCGTGSTTPTVPPVLVDPCITVTIMQL